MTTPDQEPDLLFDRNRKGAGMPAASRHTPSSSHVSTRQPRRSVPSMSLHEKTLLTGVIVGFGMLHIAAGTMLHATASQTPMEIAIPVDHGD
jgi:hypothetical protein